PSEAVVGEAECLPRKLGQQGRRAPTLKISWAADLEPASAGTERIVPVQIENAVSFPGLRIDPFLGWIEIPASQQILPFPADAIRTGNSGWLEEPLAATDVDALAEILEVDLRVPLRGVARLLHITKFPIERSRRESLMLRKGEIQ